MSSSKAPVATVLLYNGEAARWVWPSAASRLLEHDPREELIGELHPYYNDYAHMAGPKPTAYAEETDAKANESSDDA